VEPTWERVLRYRIVWALILPLVVILIVTMATIIRTRSIPEPAFLILGALFVPALLVMPVFGALGMHPAQWDLTALLPIALAGHALYACFVWRVPSLPRRALVALALLLAATFTIIIVGCSR